MFKSLASVHEDPFQVSVAPVVGGLPPQIKPAGTVPNPINSRLAVLTSLTSVQLEPLYCSTLATLVVVYPVAIIAASVEVPND